MNSKAWKNMERSIARLFGAERNRGSGSNGRADCSRSDSTHERLYIECKYSARHPLVDEFVGLKLDRNLNFQALRFPDEEHDLLVFRSADLDEIMASHLEGHVKVHEVTLKGGGARKKMAARTLHEDARYKITSSKPDRGKVPVIVLKSRGQTGVLLVVAVADLPAVLTAYTEAAAARNGAEDGL